MKKFITFTLFALVSGFALAAPSQSILSETMSDGIASKTRTLSSDGMLTESVCVSVADGSAERKHCVSHQRKVSSKEAQQLVAQMSRTGQILSSLSEPRSYGESISSGRSSSVSEAVGYSMSKAGYKAAEDSMTAQQGKFSGSVSTGRDMSTR